MRVVGGLKGGGYLQTAWLTVGSQASGWLDLLGLLVVVEDTSLTWDELDALLVDIVDLGDVVGDVCVELVLVGDDSLCVQVVAVDLCDDGLVELCVVVVLSDNGLQVLVEGVDLSDLSWELDLLGSVDAWGNSWWSVA